MALGTPQHVIDETHRRIKAKTPPFKDQTPEIRAKFANYRTDKHGQHLATYCFHDVDALDLALKFYPELDAVDWPNVDAKWAEATWQKPIATMTTRGLWMAELLLDFGMPLRELIKLPRKEFARRVLDAYERDITVKAHFDLELMEVWAGYRKPEVTKIGNVYHIGNK